MTFHDLVAQYSTTVGTGDVTLDGVAKTNCRLVSAALAVDEVQPFTMLDTATGDSMVFRGRYKSGPARLEIVEVRLALGPNASGPTSPVDWQAGEKLVVHDVAAKDFSTTPTAGAIPVAGAGGLLAAGWVPWVRPVRSSQPSGSYGVPGAMVAAFTPLAPFGRAVGADDLVGQFFSPVHDVVLRQIAHTVTVAASAGGTARLAVWEATLDEAAEATPFYTLTSGPLQDFGTVITTSTAVQTIGSLSLALRAGRHYFVGALYNLACTVNCIRYTPLQQQSWRGDNFANVMESLYQQAGLSSLPAVPTLSPINSGTLNTAGQIVFPVGLRWSLS
jgi:hypothetical protein